MLLDYSAYSTKVHCFQNVGLIIDKWKHRWDSLHQWSYLPATT